jgi:hypothetical protein
MITQTKQIVNIKTWLPVFPGFYNTLFDIGSRLYMFESQLKEHNLIQEDLKWNNACFNNDVLKKCCKWIKKELPVESGIIGIKFESIQSPREYNFANDSCNIEIELDIETFSKWFNSYIEKNIEEWADHLADHYDSREGFISFYPSDAETWVELTNNYHFDGDKEDIRRNYKMTDGTHSLGRCLEFYLLNENKSAEDSMYYYVTDVICPENYIENLPNLSYDILDEYGIESLSL